MGSSGVPASLAMAQVGKEARVPLDRPEPAAADGGQQCIGGMTVSQPPQLMIDAVVEST